MIDHKGRAALEVFAHDSAIGFGNANFVNRREHMPDPGIPLSLANREGHVAHPQKRASALLGVSLWATEILREKEELPLLARRHVRREEGAQKRIGLDVAIECLHKAAERFVATDAFVERTRLIHLFPQTPFPKRKGSVGRIIPSYSVYGENVMPPAPLMARRGAWIRRLMQVCAAP